MAQLFPDQEEISDQISKFYTDPGVNFFLLEGWAGVGKTTTIAEAIKRLKEAHPYMRVALTAPTNKAVKVLRSMAAEYDLDASFSTIYSSLGLILDNNDEIKTTKRFGKSKFEDMNLVVVDEGSMLNRSVTQHIINTAATFKVKVILMGDSYQLPPVKEDISPAFELAQIKTKLTIERRTEKGHPIRELCQSLRDDQDAKRSQTAFRPAFNAELDKGVYVLGGVDWYECVKQNFLSDEYKNDPDSFRCLAWTNKRVNSLNKSLRRLLVGETKEPSIPGERVLSRAPILKDFTSSPPEVVIHTDGEAIVLEVHETTHPLYDGMSQEFKVWRLLLESELKETVSAYVLHNDSKQEHAKMLNTLSEAAQENPSQWKHFWNFKDSFANLQPPHALTIHRSQGSTYKNVFLDVDDCFKNSKRVERTKLLYVGASRASENLLLLRR